ncbi:MAG: hypothetical protein [Microvirus sp.]|nr:MAG: hypothetical protein [Microvirus sp.]
MKPLHRQHLNKSGSARKFRNASSKTKGANLAPPPMRGGYRF